MDACAAAKKKIAGKWSLADLEGAQSYYAADGWAGKCGQARAVDHFAHKEVARARAQDVLKKFASGQLPAETHAGAAAAGSGPSSPPTWLAGRAAKSKRIPNSVRKLAKKHKCSLSSMRKAVKAADYKPRKISGPPAIAPSNLIS